MKKNIESKEKMVFEMTYEQYMELWLILYRNENIPSYVVPLTKQDYERKVNAINWSDEK
jgi:hypothetical protein